MSFSDIQIQNVWNKGFIDSFNSYLLWRKDQCGAWIYRQAYGDRNSPYGWEVDHINPDGSDDISNLRPLHWINNAERQDRVLSCPVTSLGTKNIRK